MNNAEKFAKKIFGSKNISRTECFNITFNKKYKIVVFIPPQFTDKISRVMSKAGAGVIGKYTECSFRLTGTGTFNSPKNSKPFIGKKGVLERVEETRLEMICSHENLNKSVSAMLKVHPYEEPAYDIYEILSGIKNKNVYAVKIELKKPVSFEKILNAVNSKIKDTAIPESLKKTKVINAIVDFSGNDSFFEQLNERNGKTLYITKIFNRQINMRFI